MRFGKTLDRGAIPEWRSQYISYNEGKKLISKLARNRKTFDILSGIPRTPKSRRNNTPTTAELLSPYLNVDPIESLPPPAITLPADDLSAAGSSALKDVGERSPLMLFDNQKQRYGSNTENERYISEDLETPEAKEFIAWFLKEVKRVDSFYTLHESDAIAKLKTLNQQLIVLRDHQKHFLNKRKSLKTSAVSEGAQKLLGEVEFPSLPKYLHFGNDVIQITPYHYENYEPDTEDTEATLTDSIGSESRAARRPKKKIRHHHHHNRHRGKGHSRDFEHHPYTYLQARQMLKVALRDYYHEIKELRAFQALNETAVRKICKKYDKTFHSNISESLLKIVKTMNFSASHVLDGLALEVENLFALYYRQGNHKNAVQTLQAADNEASYYPEVLALGLLWGAGVPLFVRGIDEAAQLLANPVYNIETQYLLQLWAGFFFIVMILNLFVVNMLVWRKYRVNYPFIFQLARDQHLDFRQYALMPGILWFLLCLLGWLTFADVGALPGRYYPALYLGLVCVGFIAPVPWFWKARKWLVGTLTRLLLSGLYSVEFRDFFMGDIFCSLSYTMSNLAFFFCLWSIPSWWERPERASRCSSSHSSVFGFFQCLPGIWRFLQCVRRYGDTLDWFPHLFNALKYLITIFSYMFLSLSRLHVDSDKYRILYYVFAAMNALYSAWWDVFMDFSLGPRLRSVLVYPKWSYYAIMTIDPILRFNWVLYIPWRNQIQQSQKISFIVAAIEVLRRFLWIFFRVENEQAANISNFKSYKDLELPYDVQSDEQEDHHHGAHPDSEAFTTGLETPRHQSTLFHLGEIIGNAHVRDFMRRKAVDDEDLDDYDDMNEEEQD